MTGTNSTNSVLTTKPKPLIVDATVVGIRRTNESMHEEETPILASRAVIATTVHSLSLPPPPPVPRPPPRPLPAPMRSLPPPLPPLLPIEPHRRDRFDPFDPFDPDLYEGELRSNSTYVRATPRLRPQSSTPTAPPSNDTRRSTIAARVHAHASATATTLRAMPAPVLATIVGGSVGATACVACLVVMFLFKRHTDGSDGRPRGYRAVSATVPFVAGTKARLHGERPSQQSVPLLRLG